MTEAASRPKSATGARRGFLTSEELRRLIQCLHLRGADGWRHDPIVSELMKYVRGEYAALAIKHELDPWEAVSAAFDVMRTRRRDKSATRSGTSIRRMQFQDGHKPGEHGQGDFPAPSAGLGRTREQAAAMVQAASPTLRSTRSATSRRSPPTQVAATSYEP